MSLCRRVTGSRFKGEARGRTRVVIHCLRLGLLLGSSGTAFAQPADSPDIVVTAPLKFHVVPERSLDSSDVEAYGLDTVGEVIAEIAAEDGDSRYDPAFLVNGKRVAGLGDIADLPAEAVVGIDVLPLGSGLKVGASATQRVYDIRLKRELDLASARAARRLATRGGWSSGHEDINYTHIRAQRRITATAKLTNVGLLRESERDVIQPAGSAPDAGRFRSLAPSSDRVDFSLAGADQLNSWLSGALSGKLSIAHKESLLGAFAAIAAVDEGLEQRSKTLSASIDLTLNAQVGSWQVSLFGNYLYLRGRILTDRAVSGAPATLVATTRSLTQSVGGTANAFGEIFKLPAGPVILTLGAGYSRDTIDGRRDFQGLPTGHETTLTASTLSAGIEVPIASKAAGVLGFLGDLSASAEFSRQHTSDFGSYHNRIFSSAWSPTDWLSVTGSISRSDSAPPVASLDEPLIETPGFRYFDPLRGETVDVTRITGGTPGLPRQSDETKRIGANIKPVRSLALRLTAEYLESRTGNSLSELPSASLAILQAFPERFVRDGSGRLIIVDTRPVALASREERHLRTGFSLTLPLGKRKAGRIGIADDGDDSPEGQVKPTRFGIRPRLQVNATHTWLLKSALVIRPGQPAIDLLSPEAVGFGGLGRPRHRFNVSLGYAGRGLGVRAATQIRGESFIEASGTIPNLLRFEPLTTFDIRAWVQGERLDRGSIWLKGARLSLSLLNLTDVREKVVDRFGMTPLSYQLAYREPIGRSIEIELRKKF